MHEHSWGRPYLAMTAKFTTCLDCGETALSPLPPGVARIRMEEACRRQHLWEPAVLDLEAGLLRTVCRRCGRRQAQRAEAAPGWGVWEWRDRHPLPPMDPPRARCPTCGW